MEVTGVAPRPQPAVTTLRAAPTRFLVNVVLLLVLGVLFSGWLLRYTDWFPEFGGMLALGGLFSWLGVVSKVLPEARIKTLQETIDSWLSTSVRLTRVLVGILAVMVIGANFVGTIDVQSMGEPSERLVRFFDADQPSDGTSGDLGSAARLPVAGRVRSPQFTNWVRPTTVRVKVSGFPSLIVPVRPWHHELLTVPASFRLAPVVLLVPSSTLTALRDKLELDVDVDGTTHRHLFDGNAVWVGCEDDVRVPDERLDQWRAEAPEVLPFLRAPRAIPALVRDRSQITVVLRRRDDRSEMKRKVIQVRRLTRPEDFPQVEVLE